MSCKYTQVIENNMLENHISETYVLTIKRMFGRHRGHERSRVGFEEPTHLL